MKMFLALVAVLFLALTSAQADELMVVTEEDPPLNYASGHEVTGLSAEIVKEVMRRAGIAASIKVMPWARAYQTALTRPDVLLFSLTRTAKRERRFHWIGPLVSYNWVFYARKGSGLTIETLDDARKVRGIGVYNRDARHEFLVEQGFTNVQAAANKRLNIKMLLAKRIDLLLTSEHTMRKDLEDMGHSLDEVEPLMVVCRVDLYAGLSLGSNPETLKRLHRAFKDLQAEGFVQMQQRKWDMASPCPAVK